MANYLTKTKAELLKSRIIRLSNKIDDPDKIIKLNNQLSQIDNFFSNKSNLGFYRALTECENEADIIFLSNSFSTLESETKKELKEEAEKEVYKKNSILENILKIGLIHKIFSLDFLNRDKIEKIIYKQSQKAIEKGKTSASKELGQVRPATSRDLTKLIKYNAQMQANDFVDTINKQIREEVSNGLAHNVAPALIVSSIISRSEKSIDNKSAFYAGAIVGSAINQGRKAVFDKNKSVLALQRTEILDNKICDMCLSMDGRVISANDPYAEIGQLHTHCRGYWSAVKEKNTETIKKIKPMPKSISDRFDFQNGYPITNKFKQYKVSQQLPLLKKSEINKRLEAGETIGRRSIHKGKQVTASTKPTTE